MFSEVLQIIQILIPSTRSLILLQVFQVDNPHFNLIYRINNPLCVTAFETDTGYCCQKLDSHGRNAHSDDLILL